MFLHVDVIAILVLVLIVTIMIPPMVLHVTNYDIYYPDGFVVSMP